MRTLRLAVLVALVSRSLPGMPQKQVSFRYRRSVTVPALPRDSEACTTLDAAVYAHAMSSLKDLRLLQRANGREREIPYVITLSESAEPESEPATISDVSQHGDQLAFDLAMPARAYTDVVLDLDAHNFIATAEVSGSKGGAPATSLGTFTLFDLSARHLGRDTMLPLQEVRFPRLHVALRFLPLAGTPNTSTTRAVLRAATVPPSREAQTLYTVVAEATSFVQQGQDTVARFTLPARVPVERVSLALSSKAAGNFSRHVVLTARTAGVPEQERWTGEVDRVHLEQAGITIEQEQLSFPATLGANLQADATVEVHILNGEDPPVALHAVRLEMRQRRLCFPVAPSTGPQVLDLVYGDPASQALSSSLAAALPPAERVLQASLSAESLNPDFIAPTRQAKSLMERYPELAWVGLLAVVCVFAVLATHAARRRTHP